MKPRDYHNENNAFAAQWTRNLMKAGHIPDGFVDERDIRDVQPMDLWGFTRCHFFSGIAGWAYALRLAGVPDDLPLWTGSCPCQPFSAVGQGKGAADDRHLWPAWFKLIKESRPDRVFGEQVEAAIGHGWLDLVFSDLEGQGYACGAAVLPAASVGAPHIRQRLWFVANSASGMADATQCGQPEGRASQSSTTDQGNGPLDRRSMVNPASEQVGLPGRARQSGVALGDSCGAGLSQRERDGGIQCEAMEPFEGQTALGRSNAWDSIDWIDCRDGKRRPVESGTFPLAHGVPARVGKLRAYGNSIAPQVAAAFIEAALACRP
jgi:DNA (cytosine-5)-methyltransferase 1